MLTQVTNVGEIVVGLERTPCELVYFGNQWLIFWLANAYFVRAGRIWFQYSAACAKYEASKANAWYVYSMRGSEHERALYGDLLLTLFFPLYSLSLSIFSLSLSLSLSVSLSL